MIGVRGLDGLSRAAPPLIAWAAATATVLGTAATHGYAPFAPATWSRWDSGLYLDIAHHGYTLFRCAPPNHSQWCGNAGWFPAYPWLVRALGVTGIPLASVALALSWLFGLGTLVLLWLGFLRGRTSPRVAAALAYAAFAPGQVFFYAVFPLSMLAFFTGLHLWLLGRRRWWTAGAAGAIAALAHPLGVTVIPAAALWLLAGRRHAPLRETGRRIAIVAGVSLLGPATIVVDQAIEVGRPNAYLLVQAKYGHGIHDPFGPVVHAFGIVSRSSPLSLRSAPSIQVILVVLVLVCVLAEQVAHRRRIAPTDGLLAIWASVTWLLPHLQANVSLSRSESALALMAILVRRLPLPLAAPLIAIAVWLSVSMTELFLRGALV